jgi:hypothetical protein
VFVLNLTDEVEERKNEEWNVTDDSVDCNQPRHKNFLRDSFSIKPKQQPTHVWMTENDDDGNELETWAIVFFFFISNFEKFFKIEKVRNLCAKKCGN